MSPAFTEPLAPLLNYLYCVGVAWVLGVAIGLERQTQGHPAGIRTNVLVSVGSCMFSMYPLLMGSDDLIRAAAQVITGIGFLGSGIIFKQGANVRGINTAATIWCTAAVGMICSSGRFVFAAAAAALIIFTNVSMRALTNRLNAKNAYDEGDCYYQISCVCAIDIEWEVRALILSHFNNEDIFVVSIDSDITADHRLELRTVFRSVKKRRDEVAELITKSISLETGVLHVGWKVIEA